LGVGCWVLMPPQPVICQHSQLCQSPPASQALCPGGHTLAEDNRERSTGTLAEFNYTPKYPTASELCCKDPTSVFKLCAYYPTLLPRLLSLLPPPAVWFYFIMCRLGITTNV